MTKQVDIVTEWNLKTAYDTLVLHILSVDIVTEWNLK